VGEDQLGFCVFEGTFVAQDESREIGREVDRIRLDHKKRKTTKPGDSRTNSGRNRDIVVILLENTGFSSRCRQNGHDHGVYRSSFIPRVHCPINVLLRQNGACDRY
jgi:hypothetical protein